jgi:glucan phosphoethanolaminetransferase (alkaline phosphatase superfamily)
MKLNRHILVAIAALLTFFAEKVFFLIQGAEHLLPADKYLGAVIALYIFSFIRGRNWRFLFLALILGLSFVQMVHMSFYGVPVYPSAIWLFFTEGGEIIGTLKEEFMVFLIPVSIVFPSFIILWFANREIKVKKSIPFLPLVLLVLLTYYPIRTFMTGNTYGRQPSTEEFMGMNIYLSSSYFLGKILPDKISGKAPIIKNEFKITFEQANPFNGNIIFIVGESLSANHLSLLGYKRKTTPLMDNLAKTDDNFFFTRGISSGVSTDVSVAFMINNTFGLQGQRDILQGKKCLFKFAKDSGFETSFFSTQSQQQLRYITNSLCLGEIAHYKNLEDIDPQIEDQNAADDLKLLVEMETRLKSEQNQFIVLHQRGSHGPYNLRYPKGSGKFKMVGKYQADRINHYDNSVIEFDKFISQLVEKVKKSTKPTVIFYMSDHGEGLGEEGVWGHATLKAPSYHVPLIHYYHNTDIRAHFTKMPTHLELTLFISKLLGHKADTLFPLESYTVLGNDMDGFAGSIEVKFEKENKHKSEK